MVPWIVTVFIMSGILIRCNAFLPSGARLLPVKLIIRRNLNRLLCDMDEVITDVATKEMSVVLKKGDIRAKHIKEILQLQPGDPIRSGVINIGMTNNAKIGQAGDDVQVLLGTQDSFYSGIAPNVDLILAMPRPQKLEKLLPIISCLGVRRIFLVGANKVELDYFGTHLLRNMKEMRRLLTEGLAQAEVDCILPEVHITRNLRQFIDKELNAKSPIGEQIRIIAHPPLKKYNEDRPAPAERTQRAMRSRRVESAIASIEPPQELVGLMATLDSLRASDYLDAVIPAGNHPHISSFPASPVPTPTTSTASTPIAEANTTHASKGIMMAIGPEGGWLEEEVFAFQHQGFQLVNLGQRVMRTDIAVPVLLGLANEYVDRCK